ncbi:MAG TPA: MFS transporter [Candidatus Limnocylindria bacterium]|nr:MFS transporter [Candidatus Limnocylindria bacterium]
MIHRIATAGDALRRVLVNPDIRRAQLAWMLGYAGEWSWLVALWVYAYQTSGVVAVGILGLARTVPAALLSPALSSLTDRLPRHRVLLAIHLGRATLIGVAAIAIVTDLPPLVVYAIAPLDALLGVLHRPTHMSLMPALARSPEELVASNVASSTFEGIGTLAGPALGGLLVAYATPAWGFAVPALAFAVAAVAVSGIRPAQALRRHVRHEGLVATLFGGIGALVAYPRAGLVVSLFWAQIIVRGLLNVLLVVAAVELLEVGEEGVGWLNSAIGAGGFLGVLATVSLVARPRMAPSFAVGLILWGTPILLIGLLPWAPAAVLFLAVLGLGNAVLDVAGFTIMQRSVPNVLRGRVFGVLESGVMLGTGIGSGLAPLLLALLDIRGALIVTGLILPALAAITWHWVARADADAVIPERELALLRGVPMLAPLPMTILEQVAGDLAEVAYADGQPIIREGEAGDRFYILASGRTSVTSDGEQRPELGPGDSFGEIALLRNVPRTATVVAIGSVEAFTLERDAFCAAVSGDLRSSRAADAVVERRLSETPRPPGG